MSPGRQTESGALLDEIKQLRERAETLERAATASKSQLLELERIYAAAPVGLLTLDKNLRYVRVNECLARIHGLPAADHIGRTLRDVVPAKADMLEPIYRRVLETGVEAIRFEVPALSGDVERRQFVASLYPRRSAEGETIGVAGVVQDVTTERRAERELRDSEEKYRLLADSLPQFVWTCDDAGRVDYRNRHLVDYTGLSPEEICLQDWTRIVWPDDLPQVSEVIEFAMANRATAEFEARIRRNADGEYRWFLAKASAFQRADGEWRWLVVAFDIDDRKRIEQSRSLLASIVESSSDAVAGFDREGLIESWNPAAEKLYGYSAADAIGRPISLMSPGETDGQEIRTLARVFDGERIERHETISTSGDAPDRAVLVAIAPIRNPEGRVTGAFRTVRDLTERKRVERDLLAANERLRLVQRAVKAGTWEIDIQTGAVYRSPELCELFGIDPIEATGSIDDLAVAIVHPDDRELVQRGAREAIRNNRELRLQYRIVRNGELRWLTAFGSTVAGASGSGGSARMVGITIDTTEIKKTEEAVRQSARLEGIGRLAGGVAHDFNNLLAGIMGGASFIEEMLSADHPARAMLDLVSRSSERAAHLTRQLLAYAGKGTFALRHTDLSATVQDTFTLLRGSIPDNVELLVQTGWDLPLIAADPNQLRETVLNLVINAAEAIGNNPGTVRVRTGIERLDPASIAMRFSEQPVAPGTWIFLEVSDTGSGMTPEIRRRVFEPFFTTKFTGRGLGLSAVEGIVRAHRGIVEVLSEPGKGSTFHILFPVASREQTDTAKAPEEHPGGLILVIDDEEAVRSVVRAALGHAGYKVFAASDGLSGLEMFRQRRDRISLVILDVSMPKMAGAEVYGEFEKAGIDVPVVIISGYSESEALRRIPAEGIAGFLQKPFNVRELSALVEKAIGPAKRLLM